ncbi:MAG: 5'/3'-nucleotidase SurE [Halanaerobiales bacterium]
MKILLTNDDGIYADGIRALAEVLIKKNHRVFLAAPDRERSAAGHSITIIDPLRARKVNIGIDDLSCYKVSGTPADCVKLGLEKLIDFTPDLVISGINAGPNLGYDVLYSGTVSAAIEGWMVGFNSIAVSLDIRARRNFIEAAIFLDKTIQKINFDIIPETVLLNINIPDIEETEIKGTKITRLGTSLYDDTFEERLDPTGNKYYWLTGGNGRDEKSCDTDIWSIKNNYISITPLKIDLNNYDVMEVLKKENH